jgi:hypothetical protein
MRNKQNQVAAQAASLSAAIVGRERTYQSDDQFDVEVDAAGALD